MFTALLDTCVLWPSLQRDFLLSMAVEGLYRPVWSAQILAELEYAETAKQVRRGLEPDAAARRATHLIRRMRAAFDDAETTGWEPLVGSYGLPDPDDEHVVAAAVVAGAGAVVTSNLRDFPAERVPAAVEVLSPQQFTATTVSLAPVRALAAVQAIADRSGRAGQPTRSVDDLLDHLKRGYHLTDAVTAMNAARHPA